MTSIAPVSTSLVTRPQASIDVRPTKSPDRATPTDTAAPVREPDRVELRGQGGGESLSEAEREQVEKLKARDAEVRTHEQAHVAAAGPHFRGGPTYSYQKGPDGQRYAVGGSVQIDTSPVPGDPAATVAKAQQVRRAALAPAKPSNTDQQVAAAASRMEAEAQRELTEQRATEGASSTDETQGAETTNETVTQRLGEGVPLNDEGEPKGAALDVFG